MLSIKILGFLALEQIEEKKLAAILKNGRHIGLWSPISLKFRYSVQEFSMEDTVGKNSTFAFVSNLSIILFIFRWPFPENGRQRSRK